MGKTMSSNHHSPCPHFTLCFCHTMIKIVKRTMSWYHHPMRPHCIPPLNSQDHSRHCILSASQSTTIYRTALIACQTLIKSRLCTVIGFAQGWLGVWNLLSQIFALPFLPPTRLTTESSYRDILHYSFLFSTTCVASQTINSTLICTQVCRPDHSK